MHVPVAAAATTSSSSTSPPRSSGPRRWAPSPSTRGRCAPPNLDNPDEFRIDLDPQPGRDFADAVEAALALREVMAEIGLTAYAKTSGNRGVHVYARIAPTHEFLDVRHGVIGVARELERRLPDLVTTSWWKEERGERVFVDFNQANRDRTIAGAYSPRPLPGAPVSTPLTWDELAGRRPARLHRPDRARRCSPSRAVPVGGHRRRAAATSPARSALWEADVERGLGELNFPPDYPKMPGEPPRVQPSKRKADRADDEYMAPKAERDAEWGTPIVPPFGPMLAKPVKELPEGRRACSSPSGTASARSSGAPATGSRSGQPQRAADDALLPRDRRGGRWRTSPTTCVHRRRDHPDRPGDRGPAQLRRCSSSASTRRRPGSRSSPRRRPASFVAFDLLALGDGELRRAAVPRAAGGAREGAGATRGRRST